AWMRRLAAALAGAEGDDLAQEAWLTALRRPPGALEHPRAWLGTVLRNLARMQARADARRRTREASLPPRGDEPSTEERVARAELEQLAVRHVLDLEPLHREALVLRYMRGLEPSEIARRAGVPASTVRNRIARGLEEVRVRLDERHGRRSAWL